METLIYAVGSTNISYSRQHCVEALEIAQGDLQLACEVAKDLDKSRMERAMYGQ